MRRLGSLLLIALLLFSLNVSRADDEVSLIELAPQADATPEPPVAVPGQTAAPEGATPSPERVFQDGTVQAAPGYHVVLDNLPPAVGEDRDDELPGLKDEIQVFQ